MTFPITTASSVLSRSTAPPGLVVNAQRRWASRAAGRSRCGSAISCSAPSRRRYPKEVPAGCKAMVCHAVFGGRDPRNGRGLRLHRNARWGLTVGAADPMVRTPCRRITRTRRTRRSRRWRSFIRSAPLRYELSVDSEGAGEFRGGLGVVSEYMFPDHSPKFTILADRRKFPPARPVRGRRRDDRALHAC